MKIGIIGGGISGCFLAIKIKEAHKDYQVEIIEHNDKLIKKIYATGNGKCNFANSGDLNNKYNNEDFVLPILNEYGYKEISNYFTSIGIENCLEGNLAYPVSKSANTVAYFLLKKIEELGIKSHLSTNFVDYRKVEDGYKVITGDKELKFDKIIFASGAKSSPQLGTDGSIYDVLVKHGYKMKETSPSLCPIKVKENVKLVEGIRNNVKISIYNENKLIHEETGELLFKDKGISGIVIFNACHFINQTNKKDVKIHVDFASNYQQDINSKDYISFVHPKLATYLGNNNLNIHDVVFTFKDFYDYSTSQVTSGGICLCNINDSLESNNEKGAFFIGEILDVDAICGGYNMMWAFASAYRVSKVI